MSDMLSLARAYAERDPEAVADLLEDAEPGDMAAFIDALPPAVSADLLGHLSPSRAASCLGRLPGDAVATRLGHMPPRAAAAVLREMPPARRTELLDLLPRTRRVQAGMVLRQPRQTVGAWMETRAPLVRVESTVETALRRLAREAVAGSDVYAVGPNRALVGRVALDGLLRADGATKVDALMERDPPRLSVNVGLEAAFLHPGWEGHDALPVIDSAGSVVGVIRYQDLRRARMLTDQGTVVDPRMGSFMDAMNYLYIGLAEVMDASIARKNGGTTGSRKDGAQ